MSDQEFDVLDELYFIISYERLKQSLGWEDKQLAHMLHALHEKGWIRCFDGPVHEVLDAPVDLENDYARYHYLASKSGLLAHQHEDQ